MFFQWQTVFKSLQIWNTQVGFEEDWQLGDQLFGFWKSVVKTDDQLNQSNKRRDKRLCMKGISKEKPELEYCLDNWDGEVEAGERLNDVTGWTRKRKHIWEKVGEVLVLGLQILRCWEGN